MKHLQRDLEALKRSILDMGALVEAAVASSVDALLEGDRALADTVVKGDSAIDEREITVEEDCLKILALHQPVAVDLRFIVAVLKVNNDLERMGDLAQTLAKRARSLPDEDRGALPSVLPDMTRRVRAMVSASLDSMVALDAEAARAVLRDDESVDRLHKEVYTAVQERMTTEPAAARAHVSVLSISRCLERIADLSTNIAEDVIFMVEGEVVRHGGWETDDDNDDED
ncbi:phosphate signaling complex protein PhoU [bacterium]|nr:phosphate signaling complex protein PhoU [bacterium]